MNDEYSQGEANSLGMSEQDSMESPESPVRKSSRFPLPARGGSSSNAVGVGGKRRAQNEGKRSWAESVISGDVGGPNGAFNEVVSRAKRMRIENIDGFGESAGMKSPGLKSVGESETSLEDLANRDRHGAVVVNNSNFPPPPPLASTLTSITTPNNNSSMSWNTSSQPTTPSGYEDMNKMLGSLHREKYERRLSMYNPRQPLYSPRPPPHRNFDLSSDSMDNEDNVSRKRVRPPGFVYNNKESNSNGNMVPQFPNLGNPHSGNLSSSLPVRDQSLLENSNDSFASSQSNGNGNGDSSNRGRFRLKRFDRSSSNSNLF